MKRVWVGVAVAGATLGLVVTSAGQPDRTAAARPNGRVFVVGYSTPEGRATALRGAVVLRRLSALQAVELRTTVAASRLRRAPGIRYVSQPAARGAAAEPAVALAGIGGATAWEWQFHATHEDDVPDAVLRAASTITIAVVDTGADLTAPDLAAKAPTAYDVRTGTDDVADRNGHGTFVASVAAASVTNADGIAGAGGDARLLVVKAGRADGTFTDVDEAAGIVYAVDRGARIVNLSFGGPATTPTERNAIRYAISHGVLVVAASGNERMTGNPVEYPAALLQPVASNGIGGGGLSVAASTSAGNRAVFSSTGSWISLAAPGENVFGDVSSLSPPSQYPRTALPGSVAGLYGYASGTSFAAPQVAGAAALVWAAGPGLTAQQVAQILKATASGGGHWTRGLGFGVIDVASAVAMAQATAAPQLPRPTGR